MTTIVTGIPRSGTSLMMQVLGAARLPLLIDQVRSPDASNPAGYFEYAPVRGSERDTSWVDAAAGRAVKVIHTLLPTLPTDRAYRVILLQRPIPEIVASQNRMLERLEGLAPPLPTGNVEDAFARQLERTRDFLDGSPCFEWLAVAYHELVHDSLSTLTRLNQFLRLEGRIAEMQACIDPSLHRERVGRCEGVESSES